MESNEVTKRVRLNLDRWLASALFGAGFFRGYFKGLRVDQPAG